MLGGSIDIKSQVNQGTEVKIQLPLKRVPGSDTPMSTPSSGNSLERLYDDSISALQAEHPGRSVALYGFDPKTEATLQSTNTAQVLREYIIDWFGLGAMSSSSAASSDIVIVDEKNLAALSQQNYAGSPTIVLSSNNSRYKKSHTNIVGAVEYVSKPFGPYKLAKAMRTCLDKARSKPNGLAPATSLLRRGSPAESDADTVIPDFEEMTLQTEDSSMNVQINDLVTAADSTNAQMAIENSSAGATSDYQSKDGDDFPFPSQDNGKTEPTPSERLRIDLTRRDSRRPGLDKRVTEPYINKTAFPFTSPISKTGELVTVAVETATPELTPPSLVPTTESILLSGKPAITMFEEIQKRPPRLLLVDDNKINLRLLETFMKKRKYTLVDSADNGQMAVQAAAKNEEGYDIIFMGKKPPPKPCLCTHMSFQISACPS